jgi:hypothetical protein
MTPLETIHKETTSRADEPVFVARDGRRARRLRIAGIVAGVLAIVWVVGLGVGMVGFGSLPGVALVKGAGARHHSAPLQAAVPDASRHASRVLAADVEVVRQHVNETATAHRAAAVVGKRRAAARRAARAPAATPPAAAAPAPVNPAAPTRGWSRKGYSAPRGQVRKAAPPPPPATSRGRRVGRQKPLAPPPPAVAPGQVKKAAQPPPPPPPPPKKG